MRNLKATRRSHLPVPIYEVEELFVFYRSPDLRRTICEWGYSRRHYSRSLLLHSYEHRHSSNGPSRVDKPWQPRPRCDELFFSAAVDEPEPNCWRHIRIYLYECWLLSVFLPAAQNCRAATNRNSHCG